MSLPPLPAGSPIWDGIAPDPYEVKQRNFVSEGVDFDDLENYWEDGLIDLSEEGEEQIGEGGILANNNVLLKNQNKSHSGSDEDDLLDDAVLDDEQIENLIEALRGPEDLYEDLYGDEDEDLGYCDNDFDIVEEAFLLNDDAFTDERENTKDNHPILRKRVFCRYIGGAFVAFFTPLLCERTSPFLKCNYLVPEWLFHVSNLQVVYISEGGAPFHLRGPVDLSRLPSSVKYIDVPSCLYAVFEGYSSFGDALPNLNFLRRTCMEHEYVSLTGSFGDLKNLRFLEIGRVVDMSAISSVSSLRCIHLEEDYSNEHCKSPSWRNLKELIYCIPPCFNEYVEGPSDLSYLSENSNLLSLVCHDSVDLSVLHSLTNLRCLTVCVNFGELAELPVADCLSSISAMRHLQSLKVFMITPHKYDIHPKEEVDQSMKSFTEKMREITHTLPNLMYCFMNSQQGDIVDEDLEKKMNGNIQHRRSLFDDIRNFEPPSSIFSRFDSDDSLLWYGTIQLDVSKWPHECNCAETMFLDYSSSPFLAAVDSGHVELVKAVLEKYPLTVDAAFSPPHVSSPLATSFVNRFVFDSAPLNVCLRALNRAISN